jgi:hypothetical protein
MAVTSHPIMTEIVFVFALILLLISFLRCLQLFSLQLFHQSLRRVGVHLTPALHTVPACRNPGGRRVLGGISLISWFADFMNLFISPTNWEI